MENGVYELTSAEKKDRFFKELKDLLASAAFPFMMQIIFSVTLIEFSNTDERALGIVVLVIGEIFLAAAYLVFGRQNGIAAMRKSCKNAKKRELGSMDSEVRYKTGEYALYKGIIIGLIGCVPFILVQLINCIFANTFCTFLLNYAFSWAYFPLNRLNLTEWINFVWLVPLIGIHLIGYVWGAKQEYKKQQQIAATNADFENKKRKK